MSAPHAGAQDTQAREVIDPASLRRALANPEVVAGAQRIDELSRLNDLPGLAEELRLALGDARLTEAGREWLVDRALHGLARGVPTAPARALVEHVSRRPPRVYTIADPEHARVESPTEQANAAVPAIDPGATARFVLRQWARAESRDRALAALRSGENWPLDRFGAERSADRADPARAGIVDAYGALTDGELANQRSLLITAVQHRPAAGELAAVAAERLHDADLMLAVVKYAQAPVALRAVQRARSALDPGAAFDVLSDATRRDDVASAAMLELGRLASQEPRAREFLLTSFDRATLAPSAAAALAALQEPGIAMQIGERLRSAKTEPQRRMLALALQLDGGSAARAELARFSESGAGTAQLRKEIREWLAH